MLKLLRAVGQYAALNIPHYFPPIRVRVLSVSETRLVTLGFEAPREVVILHADQQRVNPLENVLKTDMSAREVVLLKFTLEMGQYVTLKVPCYDSHIGIMVLDVSERNLVQLGFEAPREVEIERDDVRRKKREDNLKAVIESLHQASLGFKEERGE